MAIDYSVLAQPKGKTRKQLKARLARAEAKVAAWCRAQCVARDGNCVLHDRERIAKGIEDVGTMRLFGIFGAEHCASRSEWAHAHERRRSKTRGLDPTIRHDPMHSFIACGAVHLAYDQKRIAITPLTRKGFNGPVKFTVVK